MRDLRDTVFVAVAGEYGVANWADGLINTELAAKMKSGHRFLVFVRERIELVIIIAV
jgi:hypothetical protein